MVAINFFGVLLIALIVWWFWLYQPTVGNQSQTITIVLNHGVYQPALIELPADQEATLLFLRKDASPCASTVVFPDLDISAELSLNEIKPVRLPPMPVGQYLFTCPMQMYRGQLRVTESS